jgi:hypothetical protein
MIDMNRKELIMKKTVLILLLAGFFLCNHSRAEGFEVGVMVSGNSIKGDFTVEQKMGDGFWSAGVSGVYTEDGGTKYWWGEPFFRVGSDVIRPGLTCEVGAKGASATAQETGAPGDAGGVAFTGLARYDFAQQMALPGSFDIYMGFDYANKIMSFMDAEDYVAFHFGVDIPLFERAAVIMEYSVYNMDMNEGPGSWRLDDERFRVGLSMNF